MWVLLEASEIIWTVLESPRKLPGDTKEALWKHVEASGIICKHLESSGGI